MCIEPGEVLYSVTQHLEHSSRITSSSPAGLQCEIPPLKGVWGASEMAQMLFTEDPSSGPSAHDG